MLEWIGSIFYILIYQPLLNTLFILYEYLPGRDFGLAVIALTLGIRILLYPLTKSAIKSQKALSELQPKIKEIQERLKNDREGQARETLALYRAEKVNPFAGMLPPLVQLPILIALFQLLGRNLGEDQLTAVYFFLTPPVNLDFSFLGIFNLAEPNIFFAALTGILQFAQTKMLSPSTASGRPSQREAQKGVTPDFGQMMQKQMLYFFPVLTVIILLRLPSALALYWAATTVFSIGQQYFILKIKN